jgi:hypothetical protein
MYIALQNYQPLSITKSLLESVNDLPSRSLLQTCAKVGAAVLTALALLPALLIDLVLTAASLTYRCCYPTRPPIIAPPLPRPPAAPVAPIAPVAPVAPPVVVAPPPARAGRVPEANLVDQMANTPYAVFPARVAHVDFFRNSLNAAFDFLTPEKVAQYTALIENGGVVDEGEAPIDIFQWSTSILIAHYLRTRQHIGDAQTHYLFPRTIPDPVALPLGQANVDRLARNDANRTDIDRLYRSYDALTREDRAAALLQLVVPEVNWQLSAAAEQFVRNALVKAQALTQIQEFNIQIFGPVSADIDNI